MNGSPIHTRKAWASEHKNPQTIHWHQVHPSCCPKRCRLCCKGARNWMKMAPNPFRATGNQVHPATLEKSCANKPFWVFHNLFGTFLISFGVCFGCWQAKSPDLGWRGTSTAVCRNANGGVCHCGLCRQAEIGAGGVYCVGYGGRSIVTCHVLYGCPSRAGMVAAAP